jgi:hypothetical protein
MKNQEFLLSPEFVLRTERQPVAVAVQPASAEPVAAAGNEVLAALDDIARLVEGLRGDLKSAVNASELMPLLLSTRTLLETTGGRAKRE